MVHIAAQSHFGKMIIKCISPKSVPGDFPAKDPTPEYEHYRDHAIEESQDNAYEEGLPNDDDLDLLSAPDRRETTTSLLRYCSHWAVF